MPTATSTRQAFPSTRHTVSRRRVQPPPLYHWVPDFAAVIVGLGLGMSLVLPFLRESWSQFTAPGGMATFFGDVTAMAGTYLLLVMVLLASRLPILERVVGQDRLIRWHRRLSSAPLLLLGLHGVLTILGYAQASHIGFFSEAGSLITTMSWILASVVAYVMFVAIAAASIRAARRRLNYDTWWVIHLYTYLALSFSVPHQIVNGIDFVGHPLARAAWVMLWLATAGVVLICRIGLPIWRSMRHGLRIVEVRTESPGVFSLVVRGRGLDRLAVRGGQYFAWRFMTRDLWWHAHPFSISAMPQPPYLRVTIRAIGDSSSQIAQLRPGTRVAIEGPYGAFTEATRTTKKVALIGAGVGITPIRALLEDLPTDVDVVVVQRASRVEELIHNSELNELVAARGGRLVELVGSRRQHRLDDPKVLKQLIPDLARRDVYICGPEGFSAGIERSARRIGVVATAVHRESFEF